MSQVKLLKINSDGLPQEMDTAADEITLASFSVQGGGPVLSSTGLDMNNQDISDIKNVSFNNPAVDTINGYIVDDYMVESKENIMDVGASILFPLVSDSANELDAFRLPTIAGTPTQTPADGGEGYLIYDSTNDKLYAWTGSAWDDLSTVSAAERVSNQYTAGEAISAGNVVYISAADTVMKAIASSDPATRAIGVAQLPIANAAQGDITSDGVVDGFSGLVAGSRYYLSATVAGGVQTSAPTGAGHNIVNIGFAKSATKMQLQLHYVGKRA
jgi:hypothetical protein